MKEKLKATFDFNSDGDDEITILGMGPLETILAFFLVVLIVDIVFNGGGLLEMLL